MNFLESGKESHINVYTEITKINFPRLCPPGDLVSKSKNIYKTYTAGLESC